MLGEYEPVAPYDFAGDEAAVTAKYQRGSKLVASVFNKYHNGSHRIVDATVIAALMREEDALFGLQCLVEQGPAAICRERKESEVRTIASQTTKAVQGSWIPTLCGGLLGTPNTIMRNWDNLGEKSTLTAMQEYLELLEKLLPGWDDQPMFPVALSDHFWKDDAAATACAACHVDFSLQRRRHHCRMCFDIFCHGCSPHVVELQLSPGAPARPLRVCTPCKAAIDNDKRLMEVRRLVQENRDLKARIQSIAHDTDTRVHAQMAVAATLRTNAIAQGCNMTAVDKSIQDKCRDDDPGAAVLDLHIKTPPAHKFRPSESVEASEQLRVANRQLVLCLKVAETRAKKALERVDATTAVLQEAIQNQRKPWRPIARLVVPFLTIVDLKRLAQSARPFQAYIATHDLERSSCYRRAFPHHFRPQFWMWRTCCDADTHKYICDLADALSSHLGHPSDSDDALHWSSIMLKSSATWSEAYSLVVAKCGADGTLEHDKQILADVQRTFGRSSLRKQTRKLALHAAQDDVDAKKVALARVLRAFTATHSTLGYCQGMNFLAAFLLTNVHWNEAQAFWLLTAVAVSPQYQLMELYRPGVPLLNLRFYQLQALVQQLLPDLHAHFEAHDFHVSMCASGWFMTLFTNCDTLPADAVVRVLDCFLVYGWKCIFQVALALLQFLQPDLLQVDFEAIVDVFYTLDDNALILHPEYLIHAAHAMPVTDQMLNELQAAYELEFPGTLGSLRPYATTPSAVQVAGKAAATPTRRTRLLPSLLTALSLSNSSPTAVDDDVGMLDVNCKIS
ncbi:hypothetical protein, variant 1 [Aphanomyces invadans]|uniref:FYVE-type domain-containing protein n=1 Tax=Aphanomyces invadans TaxID=157072 RepID=A0A024TL92_9STRA|nr:hypothetical protein, variant 1 [Aphanomyces invadans]ETV94127.1 hypothetical protein, variant 1 [Aphanomyces invadans]|eukprot:XP_008877329.1 hypothetical protein, variant 1 [Aphanomyces invadans]